MALPVDDDPVPRAAPPRGRRPPVKALPAAGARNRALDDDAPTVVRQETTPPTDVLPATHWTTPPIVFDPSPRSHVPVERLPTTAPTATTVPAGRRWSPSGLGAGSMAGLGLCMLLAGGLGVVAGTPPVVGPPTGVVADGEPTTPARPRAQVERPTGWFVPPACDVERDERAVAASAEAAPATAATVVIPVAPVDVPSRPATSWRSAPPSEAEVDHTAAGWGILRASPEAARRHFERAIRQRSTDASARHGLGLALLALGRTEEGHDTLCSALPHLSGVVARDVRRRVGPACDAARGGAGGR